MKYFVKPMTDKKPTINRFYFGRYINTNAIVLMLASTLSSYVHANGQTDKNAFKTLDLPTAIAQTMRLHPELKTFKNQADIYMGLVQQASIQARPEIGFAIEDVMGTGEQSSFKSAQSTLSISWLLDGSLAKQKVMNAETQGATVAIERDIKALDLAAQTAKYYIQVLVFEEQLKLAKLSVKQANDSLDVVNKRVKSGIDSVVDKYKSQAEVAKRELVLEDLIHEVDASKYQLLAQWQTFDQQPQYNQHKNIKLSGSLLSIPQLPEDDSLFNKLKQLPSVNLYATKQRIAQSEIELARIETIPMWQFSTGLRRYETTDDFGLVAGVSIPFGDSNQNVGKIKALQASQHQLDVESKALLHKLNTQLYVLIEQMKHSQHVIQALTTTILPMLERAYMEAEKAYKIGVYSYTEWMNTQQELLAAQSELIDAYQNAHLNNIEIERLTGASLFTINLTANEK